MTNKIFLSLLTTISLFGADIYEGCGSSRDEAMSALSGNVISKVKSSFEQRVEVNGQKVQSSSSSNLHISSDLALVNIKQENRADAVCLSVTKEEQVVNTKTLAALVLSYKEENLPRENSDKIKKLGLWLDDIDKLSNLVPLFYEIEKKDEFAPDPKQELSKKLQKMQKEFTDIHTGLIIHAESQIWTACGNDKNDALENLSSSILSNVQSDYSQSTDIINAGEEKIEQKISSMLKVTSNLSLVNIKEEKKEKEICLSVDKKDQVENTRLYLNNVLLYTEELLPNDIEQKLGKLELWLQQIEHTQNLIFAFFKPSNEIGATHDEIKKILSSLQAKEKRFSDLYNESMLKANSLIFKACDNSQVEAFDALNKQLFKSKTKKQDDEGIFDKAGSFFSKLNPFAKKEEKILDLFAKEITYAHENEKECALIKKESLLEVAAMLNRDVARFNANNFSKEHKQRYTQIKDYQEHLNVTKALLELFSDTFTINDFGKITAVKKELAVLLESTFPQSITFEIEGAPEGIEIKLGDTAVQKGTKINSKIGKYTYTITAKGKCPIKGEISLELLEDEKISEDFSSHDYPTLTFITDKETQLIVGGKNLQPNVGHTIQKCEGEIVYNAEYASQKKQGTISLSPNLKETIKLEFLTPQELAIFNDAKTKIFITTTKTPISDSLTPISSENIVFRMESKCTHGTVDLHESGSFTYTSDENFVGVDSFKYTLSINSKESAPKVVNITVNVSNAPVAPVVAAIKKEPLADVNQTVQKVKEEVQEKLVQIQEKSQEELDKIEQRYQKFKIFVNSQEQNMEKLQKLQEKYPDLFDRLLQEKLSPE